MDPSGDAYPFFGSGAGTIWDITTVTTERRGSALWVTIQFVQPVVLPPPGSIATATTLQGVINFDTDQDPLTGSTPATALLCPTPGIITMEYSLSVGHRLANGNYEVKNQFAVPTGEATPSIGGPNVLRFFIPLSALGFDDGATHMDVILGNALEPTDCAPDGGYVAARVRDDGAAWWWASLGQ